MYVKYKSYRYFGECYESNECRGNFRSAAALNMDAILLTKGCSDPLYRRSVRVSMGTVFQIPWTFVDHTVSWPENGIRQLKELGYKTVAMALTDRSVSIDNQKLISEDKLAVVLGTEGDGLNDATISLCDYTAKIRWHMV